MAMEKLQALQSEILAPEAPALRKAQYLAMGDLLEENMVPEICQFFLDRLAQETDKYVLDAMLLALSKLTIPPQVKLDALIACTTHGELLVRRSAIYALRASDTEASREVLRSWLRRKKEKVTRIEMTYVLAAMGSVGQAEDLPLLERYLQWDTLDVRRAAQIAIDRIREK